MDRKQGVSAQAMVVKEAAPLPAQAMLRRGRDGQKKDKAFVFSFRGILPSVLPTFPAAFFLFQGSLILRSRETLKPSRRENNLIPSFNTYITHIKTG